MRSLFAGITTRGRAFIAAGIVAGVFGLGLGQRELVSLSAVLILLPLLSALAAGRARYRVRCLRQIVPARVPAGQAARVTIQLDNVTRLPTGLLLAEDTIPYALGTRPRFVLDRIEAGGSRRISYRLQSDRRGKFAVGPLYVRVADAFGLVRLGRSVALPGTLVVTPVITALPWTAFGGAWLREGGTRASTAAAAGEDDVVPRAYRDGDDLRRVHWRSTARYGELMVRREEQRWRNRAILFLDSRASAHGGRGPSSSFEYAVSAAASIGVHLAREGIDGEFVTDTGPVSANGPFEDVLLDSLAVIRPSRQSTLALGLAGSPHATTGLLVAVLGHISQEEARRLASARHSAGSALALLLAVSTWSAERPGDQIPGETQAAAGILAAAGWRVATITAGTPLAAAWELLNHPAGQPARPGSHAAAGTV
ncbi:MAG TPA: DUF58 domain-containing protein [Streptosporangiaceae bacterium]|nr:DUF58 domain-containing protein [Streptosporangiaceae bacterium]